MYDFVNRAGLEIVAQSTNLHEIYTKLALVIAREIWYDTN
jgi:hypothetical protein